MNKFKHGLYFILMILFGSALMLSSCEDDDEDDEDDEDNYTITVEQLNSGAGNSYYWNA